MSFRRASGFCDRYLTGKKSDCGRRNEELFRRKVRADHINFMAVPDLEKEMEAVGRSVITTGKVCRIRRTGEDELTAVFEEPQRAITPGQAFVFYTADGYVAGGGTIL